jgi:hypothetical protein
MSRLEDELRNAMRREDAPPGFAARVMARIDAAPARRHVFHLPAFRWAAAAVAAMLLLAAGIGYERQRTARMEGERAKEQVMLALRITGSKLQFVKEKIREMDSRQY